MDRNRINSMGWERDRFEQEIANDCWTLLKAEFVNTDRFK
jgi:hypothetical protein